MHYFDYIIPQYNEDDQKVEKLLRSIDSQIYSKKSEIGIIIVNDCSNVKLTDELFKKFPDLNIKYLSTPVNSGPGVARQVGLDNSDAEYVSFIDADDYLANPYVLEICLGCAHDISPNLIVTNFMQEYIENDKKAYYEMKELDSLKFLHGKYINRKYLIEHNIKFHNKLRFCEDNYFCNLLLSNTTYQYLNFSTLVWTYSDNSLAHFDPSDTNPFYIKYIDDIFICLKDSVNYIKSINNPVWKKKVINGIIELYYYLESPLFNNERNIGKKDIIKLELTKFVYENKEAISDFNKYELNKIFRKKSQTYKALGLKPNISFEKYLEKLDIII